MNTDNGIRLLIGADVVPTANSCEAFKNADLALLMGDELQNLFLSADMRIFNLETPLANDPTPIRKNGPALRSPEESINGIRALNPSCVALANNHIMDQDEAGLKTTIRLLDEAGLSHIGADSCLSAAAQPWIKTVHGITVGVYACTEHEFSIAGEHRFGANPFDPLESYDHVSALKEKCDFVVVLYHGGKELYRYPSPNLQRYCRKFVDKGADLVVCQHSHCIGCKEEYNGGTIVYGQGNFLFDGRNNEFLSNSLLICAEIKKGSAQIDYIPLERKSPGMRIAADGKNSSFYVDFLNRSAEILHPGTIEEKYRKFAAENLTTLISRLDYFTNSAVLRILNKLSGGRAKNHYLQRMYLEKKALALQNTVSCEAWHELLLAVLKDYNSNKRG